MVFVIAPCVAKVYDVIGVINITRDSIITSNPNAQIKYALPTELMWVKDKLNIRDADVYHTELFPIAHTTELFNTKYYSVSDVVHEPFGFPSTGEYTYWVRAGSLVLSELPDRGNDITWFDGTYAIVGYSDSSVWLLNSSTNMVMSNRWYYQNLFSPRAEEYVLADVLHQTHVLLSGGRPECCHFPVRKITDKDRILHVSDLGVKYITPNKVSDWLVDICMVSCGIIDNTAYLSIGDLAHVD